jgi:hypothetical protein
LILGSQNQQMVILVNVFHPLLQQRVHLLLLLRHVGLVHQVTAIVCFY